MPFRYPALTDYYQTYLDGEFQTPHMTERGAIAACNRLKLDNPDLRVTYRHKHEVEVEVVMMMMSPRASATAIVVPPQPTTINTLYLGAVAQGDGTGRDQSNVCTWATVAAVVQISTTVFVLDQDYSGQTVTFTDIIATELDPIIFKAFTTTPVLKGNDSYQDIQRHVVRQTRCEYVSFENINISGKRSSGILEAPRLTVRYWWQAIDCIGCNFTDSAFEYGYGWGGVDFGGTTNHCRFQRAEIQYSGTPDAWSDGVPGDIQGGNPNQLDISDCLNTSVTTHHNLFEDIELKYVGHSPTMIHGNYNICRRITVDNNWPAVDEYGNSRLYPDPWDNPYYPSRSFLAGQRRGNRAGTVRGKGDYTGRNVIEDFRIVDVGLAVDQGQIFRIAGYRTIFRFNQVQDSQSLRGLDVSAGSAGDTDRNVAQAEVYNNEVLQLSTNLNTQEAASGGRLFRIGKLGTEVGSAAGQNKVYNNAVCALPPGTNDLVKLEHQNWDSDPYPDYDGGGLTDIGAGNLYANNSHEDDLTDLDCSVWGVASGTLQSVQDGSSAPDNIFGNTGGALKSTSIRPHALTVGTSSGSPTTSLQIDNPYPFVAPNNFTQLLADGGDEIVINGTRTRILTLDEDTGDMTVSVAVTFVDGMGVYHGRSVEADNVTHTTGFIAA